MTMIRSRRARGDTHYDFQVESVVPMSDTPSSREIARQRIDEYQQNKKFRIVENLTADHLPRPNAMQIESAVLRAKDRYPIKRRGLSIYTVIALIVIMVVCGIFAITRSI